MSLEAVTITAGLVSTAPSSLTRPSAIQRSASRREHNPARAITLAMRSPGVAASAVAWLPVSGAAGSASGGIDEGGEDGDVAGADRVFGMPLHAAAEAA